MTNEEVKNMCWQIQAQNPIDYAVDDWGLHRFICLMKDNSLQFFFGYRDKSPKGVITQNLDYMGWLGDDGYSDDDPECDTDDIVMWIEVPDVEE